MIGRRKFGTSAVYEFTVSKFGSRSSPSATDAKYLKMVHEIENYHTLSDVEGVAKSKGVTTEQSIKYGLITRHYIEYFENGSLLSHMKKEPFKPHQVIDIAKSTCKTIIEMHKKGVIHKDIKPDNIFIKSIDENGNIVTRIGDLDNSFHRNDNFKEKALQPKSHQSRMQTPIS